MIPDRAINISGEIHSSKNSRRVIRAGDKIRVIKSKVSKADEQSFEWQMLAQREKWDSMQRGVEYDAPYKVCFRLRRSTNRRFDYVNIVQGLCDAMVKVGYFPDDDANHLMPSFVPYVVDKDNPGCDFWIQS